MTYFVSSGMENLNSVDHAPWRTNATSSTKPEVHNVLHYCRMRTGPRPHATCADNFVKFAVCFWDMQAARRIHIESHRHAYHNTSRPYLGEDISSNWRNCHSVTLNWSSGSIKGTLSLIQPYLCWKGAFNSNQPIDQGHSHRLTATERCNSDRSTAIH